MDMQLRRSKRFRKQYQRRMGEQPHVFAPIGFPGRQRDDAFNRPADRDAGMPRRIAIGIARRPARAGFTDPPIGPHSFTYGTGFKKREWLTRRAHALWSAGHNLSPALGRIDNPATDIKC